MFLQQFLPRVGCGDILQNDRKMVLPRVMTRNGGRPSPPAITAVSEVIQRQLK